MKNSGQQCWDGALACTQGDLAALDHVLEVLLLLLVHLRHEGAPRRDRHLGGPADLPKQAFPPQEALWHYPSRHLTGSQFIVRCRVQPCKQFGCHTDIDIRQAGGQLHSPHQRRRPAGPLVSRPQIAASHGKPMDSCGGTGSPCPAPWTLRQTFGCTIVTFGVKLQKEMWRMSLTVGILQVPDNGHRVSACGACQWPSL